MTALRKRPLLWGLVVAGFVAVLAGVAVFVVTSIPKYRTTFLVDASVTDQPDFQAVRRSVVSATQNAGDDDALALRRFGGECGNEGNTRSLVDSGKGNREQIGAAAQALTAQGKATLGSGLLAAIDDFAGRHPFRGSEGNRIIVVTTHGTDACGGDPAELGRLVKSRAKTADVDIDMRFVGFKVPAEARSVLGKLATTAEQPAPDFPQNGAELATTLKKYTVPTSPDGKKIALPTESVTTRPCTWEDWQTGEKKTSRPSKFDLPEQVKLPPGAAVYDVPYHPSGSGVSRFVAEAGKATCSSGPNGHASEKHHISARVQKPHTERTDLNNPDHMSWVDLTIEDPHASCYLFPKNPDPPPGYVASNCETVMAAMVLTKREEIPTGNPQYKAVLSRKPFMGNYVYVPGTVEFALAVDRPGPHNPAVLCIQPKSRASLCAAALTFHFVEAMKGVLPKDKLDAGARQIQSSISGRD